MTNMGWFKKVYCSESALNAVPDLALGGSFGGTGPLRICGRLPLGNCRQYSIRK